ncbi:MAG: hypothetical protein M3295_09440, partial [Chloroflexota bacterium]|nr:hypothetical protein [Chloroflexota bacterium]
ADEVREARGEVGFPVTEGADVGSDAEPGPIGGPTTARGNLDARRPLGDDETVAASGAPGGSGGGVDRSVPYPAPGLDTDEAQDEPG